MQIMKCSFSGEEIPRGTGIMYISKTGRVYYFKNRKAEKNFLELKRKPRNTGWTEEYHAEKTKAKSTKK